MFFKTKAMNFLLVFSIIKEVIIFSTFFRVDTYAILDKITYHFKFSIYNV